MQLECITALVRRWLETRDPQFMDQAVLYCHDQGLPILPSLLEQVAASIRLRRTLKPAQKMANESTKGRALNIMANLVARDVSIDRASEVAAVWTFDNGTKGIKASTLVRQFAEGGFKAKADAIKERLPHWNEPGWDEAWQAIERNCRVITDEEKGERR